MRRRFVFTAREPETASAKLMGVRALALWTITAVPVLAATVGPWTGRLSIGESLAGLAVLGVAAAVVERRPVVALVLVVAAWQITFLSRAPLDSTLGVLAFAGGLLAVSFVAGRNASTGTAGAVVLLAGTATGAVAAAALGGGGDTALGTVAAVAVLAVVPWTIGRYRRQYTRMVRAGWEHAERVERELELAEDRARTRERARLAGEMHDLIGHELAHAALRIGALEVDAGLDQRHRSAAGGARAAVTTAAERLADAVRVLRADQSGIDSSAESMAELVARTRASGLDVELVADPPRDHDPLIARTIHRVVAEALTNAIKHAPGAPVTVRIEETDEGSVVRVANAAAAEPPEPGVIGGHGLLGLAERVRLVGGRFDAGRSTDGGYEVTAHVPHRPSAPAGPATTTHLHRRQAELQVRRSGRRTVLVTAAVSAGVVACVVAYMVVDAVTSVLDPADYARLTVGQDQSSVTPLLPAETRVDLPDGVPPPPAGSACSHYSTHPNPFDERGSDLYRLCFRDGHLVSKDLLVRGARLVSGDELVGGER
ncbi:sensor histidine kinase [Pseudonocardia sp. CA-142604]|uniref:sensor histidine kinase n=1 Tax=Pseudonocardia sp. CA-142604 TaxID=3240024 RepID=UPI003D938E56